MPIGNRPGMDASNASRTEGTPKSARYLSNNICVAENYAVQRTAPVYADTSTTNPKAMRYHAKIVKSCVAM